MDIKEYIASGILEAYALNTLSENEMKEVEAMLNQYPELNEELAEIEKGLESFAIQTAIEPPNGLKDLILDQIEATPIAEETIEPEHKVIPLNAKKKSVWAYVAAASIVFALFSSYQSYQYKIEIDRVNEANKDLKLSNQNIVDQSKLTNDRLDQLANDLAVISNPDFIQTRMQAVKEGESLTASVYWNAETQAVYLNTETLISLPQEKQYQLWAIVEGKPVNMGVFDAGKIHLLSMENIANAAMFAVTIEPKGGSESPTLETMQVAGKTS